MPNQTRWVPREHDAPHAIWGENLEPDALKQMRNACELPVAVAGALMPDAHVGYGLPIGGVLATGNAVIPYAVGVDIACRMKLTVLDLPLTTLAEDQARLTRALERETRFGMGASFKARREHDVMDEDWRVTQRDRTPEGQGVVAARHERQRQPLRRVRPAHRARRGGRPAARASTSRCSASRAAAAPGAQVAAALQSRWRASSTRSCRRSSRTSRGSISRPRPARNTGRRWT